MRRPVCYDCLEQFGVDKIGITVLVLDVGSPWRIFQADLWRCKKCDYQIIGGWGNKPIAVIGDEHWDKWIDEVEITVNS